MFSPLTRWCLFLSSWLPSLVLWTLFALPSSSFWALCFLFLGLLGLLALFLVIKEMTSLMTPISSQVTVLRERGRDVQYYMIWYALPLLIQPWVSFQQTLALLVVFAMVGTIYVRSQLLHVNPVLLALGFRLYEVQVAGKAEPLLLLAHQRVSLQQPVNMVHLTDHLLWASR